jgi:prepilin-type N-terminal cleavage/methylation domain-containing protein
MAAAEQHEKGGCAMCGANHRVAKVNGFTLIELLVVISIIALVTAILLPALASSRRIARNTSCQTRLREIGAGMQHYGVENEEWIVGSPAGSGAYLGPFKSHGPATQNWDFAGPLAHLWVIPLPEESGDAETARRFNQLRRMNQFSCASNDFLADCYDGPNAGAGPMVSYNTSRYMLFEDYRRAPGSGYSVGARYYNNCYEEKLPSRWSPRITRVGDPARKIFAADGARWATVDHKPDYDLVTQAEWGGAFSDASPYNAFTRSWDRSAKFDGGFDARVYSFRHATAPPGTGGGPDAFRMQMIFFDGHVENMNDLQAADPVYWLPAGSRLEINENIYPDVIKLYGLAGIVAIN